MGRGENFVPKPRMSPRVGKKKFTKIRLFLSTRESAEKESVMGKDAPFLIRTILGKSPSSFSSSPPHALPLLPTFWIHRRPPYHLPISGYPSEAHPCASTEGWRCMTEELKMEQILGLLKVKVVRGVNLAVRDVRTSDPYAVVRLGKHKLKTHVIKKNVNPEWNEDLTLSVHDPSEPIKVQVYDKDTFSQDDPMGNAYLSIEPFIDAVKLNLDNVPNRTIIKKIAPNRNNCLADESAIYWMDGKVVQDVILRLRNVECGEIELQLQWVSIPNIR